MKSAVTLADAPGLSVEDVFDLDSAYEKSVSLTPRNTEDRQGYFHPSAVGMCGRRNVYEYIRAPAIKTIDAPDLEVFDMGHAVHDIVQTKLAKLELALDPQGISYSFQKEVPFDPKTDTLFVDLGVGGTCDGLLTLWTDTWRQRGIVEIKSIKNKLYDQLTGPKEDHVMQAHLYSYRFDCPVMWLWYYNKDTSHRRVYPVVFQQAVFDEAVKRYEGWLAHVDAGTLPDREESFWACPRCEYRKSCNPPIVKNVNRKKYGKKLTAGRRRGLLRRM